MSAKDDVNIGDIFKELLAQANIHLEQMLTVKAGAAEAGWSKFSFRRAGGARSRELSRAKRTSCQVS